MDGPDFMLTNFLTFLPSPKRLLPITAADRGLWGAVAGSRGFLTGRHIPCKMVERHGLRRPLPRVSEGTLRFYPPTAVRKVRTRMRIDIAPSPQPLPATFVCTVFAILMTSFIALVPLLSVRGLFYF